MRRTVVPVVVVLLVPLGACGRSDAADAGLADAFADSGAADVEADDPGTNEESSDGTTGDVSPDGPEDDASPDGADGDVGPECLVPRPDNPFLGCPDLSDCEPRVCDTGGRTWDDIYFELKDFLASHPPCTRPPADLRCMLKTAVQGSDWPDDAEHVIALTAASADGLLPDQVRALRCLAFAEPSYDFSASGGEGIPTAVRPNLELDLASSGEAAAGEFLARYGVLLGTLFHITPGSPFAPVELPLSWKLILQVRARTYQGIPFA